MKNRFTDHEIREMWKAWGGGFHGPHIETVTMPEANFLKMMRAILNKDLPTPPSVPKTDLSKERESP